MCRHSAPSSPNGFRNRWNEHPNHSLSFAQICIASTRKTILNFLQQEHRDNLQRRLQSLSEKILNNHAAVAEGGGGKREVAEDVEMTLDEEELPSLTPKRMQIHISPRRSTAKKNRRRQTWCPEPVGGSEGEEDEPERHPNGPKQKTGPSRELVQELLAFFQAKTQQPKMEEEKYSGASRLNTPSGPDEEESTGRRESAGGSANGNWVDHDAVSALRHADSVLAALGLDEEGGTAQEPVSGGEEEALTAMISQLIEDKQSPRKEIAELQTETKEAPPELMESRIEGAESGTPEGKEHSPAAVSGSRIAVLTVRFKIGEVFGKQFNVSSHLDSISFEGSFGELDKKISRISEKCSERGVAVEEVRRGTEADGVFCVLHFRVSLDHLLFPSGENQAADASAIFSNVNVASTSANMVDDPSPVPTASPPAVMPEEKTRADNTTEMVDTIHQLQHVQTISFVALDHTALRSRWCKSAITTRRITSDQRQTSIQSTFRAFSSHQRPPHLSTHLLLKALFCLR